MGRYCNQKHRRDKLLFILINLLIQSAHFASNEKDPESESPSKSGKNALGLSSAQLDKIGLDKNGSVTTSSLHLDSHFSRNSNVRSTSNFVRKSSISEQTVSISQWVENWSKSKAESKSARTPVQSPVLSSSASKLHGDILSSSQLRIERSKTPLNLLSTTESSSIVVSSPSKIVKSSLSLAKSSSTVAVASSKVNLSSKIMHESIGYSTYGTSTESLTQSIAASKSNSLTTITAKNMTSSQSVLSTERVESSTSSATQSNQSTTVRTAFQSPSSSMLYTSIVSSVRTMYPVSTASYSSSESTTSASSSVVLNSTVQSHAVTPHPASTKTVTICPWGTLITANIMPSPSVSYIRSSSMVVHNTSDIIPAKRGCDVVLLGMSNSMANISNCMLKFSHPMEVCRKCTGPFTEMEEYHTLVFKKCEKELIDDYFEQYQIIPRMYGFQQALWNRLQCDKCYKSRDSNDPKASWVPTEEFVKFEKLLMQAMRCFANHSKLHLPYPVTLNNSHSKNSTNTGICTNCRKVYVEFRKLVRSEDEKETPEKKWCADMVYGLNETRKIWASNCVEKQEDMQSIIALTCFFCFIPIVFYVGTKLHSDVKERKNESRLNYESD